MGTSPIPNWQGFFAGAVCLVTFVSACGDDSEAGEEGTSGSSSGGTVGGGASGKGGSGGSLVAACKSERSSAPELVSPVELDPDVVARAAAVLGSCWPDDGVDRNAAYLWNARAAADRFYFRFVLQAECLAGATCGCDAVEHCLGLGYSDAEESCVPGCNSGKFSACGIGEESAVLDFHLDCGALGQECDSKAVCSDEPAVACDNDDLRACSSDGRVEYCEDGFVRHGPVCANLGLTCENGACVGSGAECQGFQGPDLLQFSGASCAGATLAACVNGRLEEVDCSTLGPGFSCQSVVGKAFCGLAAECVPAEDGYASESDPPRCDGAALSFCNAGRLEHLDCLALGFTGCNVDDSLGEYGCSPGPASSGRP